LVDFPLRFSRHRLSPSSGHHYVAPRRPRCSFQQALSFFVR
jgi:hypothetical protein